MLNDTCAGFSNEHFFLIPDKIKVSHIILDHFIATLMAGHISHHMTKILISAKTQGQNLRMSHHLPWQRLSAKIPVRSETLRAETIVWTMHSAFLWLFSHVFQNHLKDWLTMLKPLTLWITTNCGIFLKRWESQATLPASWETCMQDKKQQLELDMEKWTGSKLGKEYVKAVYCHPAYLTYMQSISYNNAGLGESQVGIRTSRRNINISDTQMTLLL